MASSRTRGFSLVEGLIGTTILALTTTAAFIGWSVMLRRNSASRFTGQSGQLARAEIERVKIVGADGLPLGVYDSTSGTAVWSGVYDANANSGAGGWVANQVAYYDGSGNQLSSASGATLIVQDTITDSSVMAVSTGGYALQPTSRRDFVAQVTSVADGTVTFRMGTTLVQGGL